MNYQNPLLTHIDHRRVTGPAASAGIEYPNHQSNLTPDQVPNKLPSAQYDAPLASPAPLHVPGPDASPGDILSQPGEVKRRP